MKTIAATVINDVITPVSELPTDAKLIVFDGTEYIIYEEGDELPDCYFMSISRAVLAAKLLS